MINDVDGLRGVERDDNVLETVVKDGALPNTRGTFESEEALPHRPRLEVSQRGSHSLQSGPLLVKMFSSPAANVLEGNRWRGFSNGGTQQIKTPEIVPKLFASIQATYKI